MTVTKGNTVIDIEAPMSRVVSQLAEMIEIPRKYDGDVQWSTVIESGADYHVIETSLGGALHRERVTKQETPGEVCYSFESDGGETRTIHCRETPNGATLEVEGQDDGSLERRANRLKQVAEHPCRVPAWLQTYFDTVDKMDIDALMDQIHPDCVFQVGNMTELRGRGNVRAASLGMWSHLTAIRHHILSVYEDQGRTITEVFTDHTLPDGRKVLLPAVTFFRRSGPLVSSVRIYGDSTPLFAGWPTQAH